MQKPYLNCLYVVLVFANIDPYRILPTFHHINMLLFNGNHSNLKQTSFNFLYTKRSKDKGGWIDTKLGGRENEGKC